MFVVSIRPLEGGKCLWHRYTLRGLMCGLLLSTWLTLEGGKRLRRRYTLKGLMCEGRKLLLMFMAGSSWSEPSMSLSDGVYWLGID